jgi:hypothetical protein
MKQIKLVEIAPGRWRVDRPIAKSARADLPLPYVISDSMPPTEQVDGNFYESKRAFRQVGRALGLTEVGNEKPKPRRRVDPKAERRRAIATAIERFKSR